MSNRKQGKCNTLLLLIVGPHAPDTVRRGRGFLSAIRAKQVSRFTYEKE